MADHLVLSALSHDRPGIIDELSSWIAKHNGNIEDSRMAILGGEFAIIMLISGSEECITALNDQAQQTWEPKNIQVSCKVTTSKKDTPPAKARVEVYGLDHPGIIHEIARFFAERNINIESMETSTQKAPHTAAPMISVEMLTALPPDTHLKDLRTLFLDYCDQKNLDAVLEPV